MIFYPFLLLWASRSVSMPASLSEVSYVTDISDRHGDAKRLSIPSSSSWPSDLTSTRGAGHWRRSVDNDPWTQAEATFDARTPENTTQDQQTGADDRFAALTDNMHFKMTCNTGDDAVLSMDDMWIHVGTVILDLSQGIYQRSIDWALDLPDNEDITVWLHMDIFDPNPALVHTVLIRNMFQMVVYNESCYGPDKTKGGSVLAMRAGQGRRKLANVGIYAVDRKDV